MILFIVLMDLIFIILQLVMNHARTTHSKLCLVLEETRKYVKVGKNKSTTVHVVPSKYFLRLYGNSEVNASEFLYNLEDMIHHHRKQLMSYEQLNA